MKEVISWNPSWAVFGSYFYLFPNGCIANRIFFHWPPHLTPLISCEGVKYLKDIVSSSSTLQGLGCCMFRSRKIYDYRFLGLIWSHISSSSQIVVEYFLILLNFILAKYISQILKASRTEEPGVLSYNHTGCESRCLHIA